MSKLLVRVAGLVVVAVTNIYWWRHVKKVREGLTLSRERAIETATEPSTSEGAGNATLVDAAKRAGVDPNDLPERVDEMNDEIRTLSNEVDDLRSSWATSWYEALNRNSPNQDGHYVLVVPLDDADVDIAETFASVAVGHDAAITIILGLQDGSCTVTVGENLRDEFSAASIIDEITDRAGGGGGGSESLATGGGTRPEDFEDVVESIQEDLSSRLQSSTDR